MKKCIAVLMAVFMLLTVWAVLPSDRVKAAGKTSNSSVSSVKGIWENNRQSMSDRIDLIFGTGNQAAVVYPRFMCTGTWTGDKTGKILISVTKIITYNNANGNYTETDNTSGVSFVGQYDAAGKVISGTCTGSPYSDQAVTCSFTCADPAETVSGYRSYNYGGADPLSEALTAYRVFLSDTSNFNTLMTSDILYALAVNPASSDDIFEGFFLYDSDWDGIPELYLEKVSNFERYAADIICYKYDAGTGMVVQSGDVISNYTSNEKNFDTAFLKFYAANGGNGFLTRKKPFLFGYRTDNGDLLSTSNELDLGGSIYIYEYRGGQLTANANSVYEEDFGMTGDMNSDYCDYSQTSKKVYSKIMKKYRPMRFYPVTQNNLDKFLVAGYKKSGMYKYTLNDCINDLTR